jgi:hypothetical protein
VSFREYQGLAIPPDGDEFRYLVLRNHVTGSSSLFRSELKDRVVPFPTGLLPHDWWLALHAACVGGIRYVDKPLTLYRQHSQNAIGAKKRPTIPEEVRLGFSKTSRTKAYEDERKRFVFLMERGLFPDESKKEYLQDLIRYCDSYLGSTVHFDAVKIAGKYRDVFFPGMGSLKRAMFLVGKLFG